MTTPYNKAKFLFSVAKMQQLSSDDGLEVAFVGRSNSGKSSALNAITGQKNLARTSKTPGRTQLINFFALDDNHRLVDLPGYGFAKAQKTIKQQWQQAINDYLESRKSLAGLIVLMDIRHPLKPIDQQLIDWAVVNQIPLHILLTKADKLSRSQALNTLAKMKQVVQDYPLLSLQLFSATKKLGLEQVYQLLDSWLYS